jgi:hypothetical protein
VIDVGIKHRFDGDELVIAADKEDAVDLIVAGLTSEQDAGERMRDGRGAEAEEAAASVVLALADAARRLREDPEDMVADGDLAAASVDVFGVEHVRGLDDDDWAAVGRVTRRLLGALGADVALEQEISTQASVLCRLLEPVAPADAPPAPDVSERSVDEDAGEGGEDKEEVVYELEDWLPEHRAELSLRLEAEEIGYAWEPPDLVVPAAAEARVD